MSTVPYHLDFFGKALDQYQDTLIKLGNLETRFLKYDLIDVSITQPLFITGLARSGTTILTEILNAHKSVTSHQYRDFPLIHVIYFWNIIQKCFPTSRKKIERAHRDRMMINSTSPEALEEIIWMSFFNDLHNPKINSQLDKKTVNQPFEDFYKDHIRKLLFIRKSTRFVTKNNYNLTRIPYLLTLFPDAKFLIPLRKPEEHIFSLLKQNNIIRNAQKEDPRADRYMKRHGHFEFGLDFRPINAGDNQIFRYVRNAWNEEKFLEAYTYYWLYIHTFIIEHIMDNPSVSENCLFFTYDNFCHETQATLRRIFTFCDLEEPDDLDEWSSFINAPDYYNIALSPEEKDWIHDICQPVTQRIWGS